MSHLLRRASALIVFGFLVGAGGAAAQKPSPLHAERYLCPNAEMPGVDCFLHAVEHLYTMCRQVKSIEIIEFGYEKATEGVNGAKSQSCVEKHKPSMLRLYRTALKEVFPNRAAGDQLTALHKAWIDSLADLQWRQGESDEHYKERVAAPYAAFSERSAAIRTALEAKRKPAVAEKKPAVAEKKAAVAENKPAAAEKKPAVATKAPAKVN